MKCKTCGGKAIPLLIGVACDVCDNLPAERQSADSDCSGYVVWRDRPPGSNEYVFRTERDAELWRQSAGLSRCPIKPVRTSTPMRWRKSIGTVQHLELADRMYEIFFIKPENRTGDYAWRV